jgi:predicted GIY-YIG superfamily endonuclease
VVCVHGAVRRRLARHRARQGRGPAVQAAQRRDRIEVPRTRLPVELVYQEAHPSQSSALKREAAIKALDRREKLAMAQQKKKPAKAVREVARLEDIPNLGPAVAGDLRRLGITTPAELPGRDPYALYDKLCRITGPRHDPCVLDTFIAAVRDMEGAPKRPRWKYTAERKRVMAARTETGG